MCSAWAWLTEAEIDSLLNQYKNLQENSVGFIPILDSLISDSMFMDMYTYISELNRNIYLKPQFVSI